MADDRPSEATMGMPAHGSICWTELGSRDVETAKTFYTELLGWTVSDSKANDEMNYMEFKAGEGGPPVGGMYQLGEKQPGVPSHWMSYVAVDDVDAAAKRVEELKGRVILPVTEIPQVGRFCVIQDPTGATIALITLAPHPPHGAST